ncbi:macro domain-containing protein [Candidatus Woesearchaeota archaeon]|nr:macro domain-containing protein [Candidatus Woesearchaeota archaeon]
MITEVTADILELKVNAIAHGCNTQGIMNAGLAKVLKERFPIMYKEYKAYCETEMFNPGDIHFYRNPKGPNIINIATQIELEKGARLDYIEEGLKKIEDSYSRWGINSLAVPRIGCGLGGLAWRDVRRVIYSIFGSSNLDVRVVTKPH